MNRIQLRWFTLPSMLAALWIVAVVLLCSCNNADVSFTPRGKKSLSANVWLHRTSASMVTINDKDGFGLVNGNVIKCGYAEDSREHFMVAYRPFESDGPGSDQQTNLLLASINLKTGESSTLTNGADNIIRRLNSVQSYLP